MAFLSFKFYPEPMAEFFYVDTLLIKPFLGGTCSYVLLIKFWFWIFMIFVENCENCCVDEGFYEAYVLVVKCLELIWFKKLYC